MKRMAKQFKSIPKDKKPAKESETSGEARIFTGGTILPVVTSQDDQGQDIVKAGQTVEAMGIFDGKVISVGSLDEVTNKMKSKCAQEPTPIPLNGKTLVPGFIDPHVHIGITSVTRDWYDYTTFDGQKLRNEYTREWLKDKLKDDLENMSEQDKANNYWLLGCGVDPALMVYPKDPDRDLLTLIDKDFLDDIPESNNIPILLISASLHTAYVNTAALDIIKINNPELSNSDGVLQELDQMNPALNAIPEEQQTAMAGNVLNNIDGYLQEASSRGLTMLYDAGGMEDLDGVLDYVRKSDMRIGYARMIKSYKDICKLLECEFKPPSDGFESTIKNSINLYLGSAKIVTDGSNQGLTGYQSEPYRCPPEPNYGIFNYGCAKPVEAPKKDTPSEFISQVSEIAKNGWPQMIHANGNQAVKYTI